MPNWCRGTLEVRGTKDNIKKFLLENFNQDDKEVNEEGGELTIRSKEGFYIEGTKKNFVDDDIVFYFGTDETVKQCTLSNFMAAWYIDPEPYAQMSKKYDIEIEISGLEVLGGFSQEIKIQKGELIKNVILDEFCGDFRSGDYEENTVEYEPLEENTVEYEPLDENTFVSFISSLDDTQSRAQERIDFDDMPF